ncbi:response regulator [candidate division KSB1 bacterium]|nr:response regulator [candidate division KSB1 bacterium]
MIKEKLQKENNSIETAELMKDEFLANISHEIRTPMNSIMGFINLTLETTNITSEQEEYLNIAKSSAEILLTLMNDLIELSKTRNGDLELNPIEFSLRDCIVQTLKPLLFMAELKKLKSTYNISPDIPDMLIADPGRLKQVITNLIGNAIKFTHTGEVTLRVSVYENGDDSYDMTEHDLQLHFSVSDTGIGVPAEKKKIIFDAFVQADGSSTREYPGAGIGLSISEKLVELMGGKIWVESKVGEGSTFHFTSRFSMKNTAMELPSSFNPKDVSNLTALVVDPNSKSRTALIQMLNNLKITTQESDNGFSALEELKHADEPFSLILLEIDMPTMDGFELSTQIRSNPEWDNTIIIVHTSAGQRGDAIRCRELGIAAYLSQTISQSELLDVICTARIMQKVQQPPALITRHSIREKRRDQINQ